MRFQKDGTVTPGCSVALLAVTTVLMNSRAPEMGVYLRMHLHGRLFIAVV